MRLPAALTAVVMTVLPAACERRPEPPPVRAPATELPSAPADGDGWRASISPADASTLGRLGQAWRLARAEAEDAGFAPRVEAFGPLVDPNAGLAGNLQPAPGDYRCRVIGLGARTAGDPAHVETPWGRCTVELAPGGDLWLAVAEGPRRLRGRLHPESDRRLVFLGAEAAGDDADLPDYGEQPRRDRVGVFERIAPSRWRLVLPWPRQGAKLEILELVP